MNDNNQDEIRQLLHLASEELRAAQQLHEDMELNPKIALIHLLRVWHHLAYLLSTKQNDCDNTPLPMSWSSTPTALAQSDISFSKQLSAEVWQEDLTKWFATPPESLSATGDEIIARSHLGLHLHLARKLLRKLEREYQQPRFDILGSIRGIVVNRSFWIAILIVLALFGVYSAYSFFEQEKVNGHWKVAFYSNAELLGKPILTETARSISVDWRGQSPKEGVPHSVFSTRWDTCLSLSKPKSVRVRLGADDGARFLIDGKSVVSLWEQGGFRTTERTLTLPAGQTLLSLEYFQQGGASRILLDFDTGDGFGDLPLDWIVSPRLLLGKPSCS
jgi:hypothetical protein